MTDIDLLRPMMALAGWTFVVLLLVPYRRFRAFFAGRVRAEDFRFGESAQVPGEVILPNRNYMNLLELPVLFYLVGFVHLQLDRVDALAVQLAWAYVILRVLHSLLHLSYNNVMHRLVIFSLSNVALLLLWAKLLPELL